MPDFRWNENAGRFIGSNGRFVPEATIRSGVDALVDRVSQRLQVAARGVADGSVSAQAFRDVLFQGIKDVHIGAGLAAYGGQSAMNQERYGFLGSEVKKQYEYARGFLQDIVSGKQPLDGRLAARAAMYAESGRTTYEHVRMREAERRGRSQVRNVLHAKESCDQCKSITGRGWIPIDEMPPVGSRTCLSRCRCSLEYRGKQEQAA